MAYTARPDIEASLPPQFLDQALDDDGDGSPDDALLDLIIQQVQTEIDGTLGQRFNTPFADPPPSLVRDAARILTLDELYRRRGLAGQQNPWSTRARELRDRLEAIARGEQPLRPGEGQASPSVRTITSPAKTHNAHGHTSC